MKKGLLCLSYFFADEDTEAQGSWKSLAQGLTAQKNLIQDSEGDSVTPEYLLLIITVRCLPPKSIYVLINQGMI